MEKLSTTKIIILVFAHVVIYCAALFTMIRMLGGKMDTEHPFRIGEGGRRTIFGGLPAIGLAIFIGKGNAIDEFITGKLGPNAFPYIFFGIVIALFVTAHISYSHVPRRYVIPFGIFGWVIAFTLMYWLVLFRHGL